MAHMKPRNRIVEEGSKAWWTRKWKVWWLSLGLGIGTYFVLRMGFFKLLSAILGEEMWDDQSLAICTFGIVCYLFVDGIMDESPESSGDSEPPAP